MNARQIKILAYTAVWRAIQEFMDDDDRLSTNARLDEGDIERLYAEVDRIAQQFYERAARLKESDPTTPQGTKQGRMLS